jgi:hypothetical protein
MSHTALYGHQHSKHKDRPREYRQYPTHRHANKNNGIRVQKENLREKHTHWHTSTRIGKRGTPTKRRKKTYICF